MKGAPNETRTHSCRFASRAWPHANDETREMAHDGMNGTTESRKNRTFEEMYKYLGILVADTIKQVEIK